MAVYAGLAVDAVAQDGVATDRAALVALYGATGGLTWTDSTNWTTDAPLGEWYGVRTGTAGRVTSLDLRGNKLTGPIPEVLGGLSNLTWLGLGTNGLTGPIPEVLGGLSNLEWLNLGTNELTGPIPEVLGGLPNLRSLHLHTNNLTGPIPEVLGGLSNLEWLNLGTNELTGPIPEVLGGLSNLTWLGLGTNGLTGPIPEVLGGLSNLRSLHLHTNNLTGPIPEALGGLSNLEWLNLGTNELTGPIPEVLGGLSNLTWLGLGTNGLTGPIPEVLGGLSNLRSLHLHTNNLTGPIPEALGGLSNLEWLNLGTNELTGPIPEALGGLSNLTWLGLGTNGLTGPIPEVLGGLSNLQVLHLGSNELTGPIPEVLGGLSNLEWLNLGTNELTGPIPEVLGGLSNLRSLHLHTNNLTGPIPEALGGLSNLEWLNLGTNELTGPIPEALGGLPNLRSLDLHTNNLTGPIPEALGGLSNLQVLHLGSNELTGPIPEVLGGLSNLTSLDLGANGLTGPIPDALGRLSNLQVLNLGSNELTGPIPEVLGGLSNLEWLRLEWNGLSGSIPEALGGLSNLKELLLSNSEMTGPLPFELTRLSRLTRLEIQNTGLCAPADSAFQEWLAPIDFSGSTCRDNRAPETVAMIPDQTLTVGGAALGVGVAGYFRDPDDDPLSYEATSSHGDRATVSVSGSVVWLAPGEAGTATVTVTARDPGGLSATRTMAVTVDVSSGRQSDFEVLAALYGATGGPTWTDSTNWTTDAPLGEWYGVTTNADGRVTSLDLRGNKLTGPIPEALGGLSNLEWLNLGANGLTGPIPEVLGGLSNLQVLNLGSNELTGPIPEVLGGLSNLTSLDLGANGLTGPIPEALGGLSNLEWLNLGSNELTGPIPEVLGGLSNLVWLSLSNNALTGPIPDALGRLSNLQVLNLGSNELTGPIPEVLGGLSNLESLDLSYNWGVSGPLPDGRRLPRLRRLDIGVTQACLPSAWRDWVRTIDFRGAPCGVEGEVTIDVAVVYTPAAREAAGGAAAIESVSDLMIAETNQAYAESGVRHRIALAARSEVPYMETGDSHIDIDRLRDPSDGYMDEAHALRETSGADLVHLLFDEGNVGGIADVGGAFGLTCQRCGGQVFAHETGHNLGLRHDRYEWHKKSGMTSGDPAYGYVNQRAFDEGTPPSSRWRTIMAYSTQCDDANRRCPGLLRFSNPRQTWLGDPLGVAYEAGGFGVTGPADAVAVLNAMGPAVAAWRDRPPPEPESFSIPNLGGWSITSSGTETTTQVGYGRIAADAGSTTPSGIAIIGYRPGGTLVAEAGVPASEPVREGRIFAEVNGPVNTGLAIANPNDAPATINFYFTDADGARFSEDTYVLDAGRQISKFLNETPFNGGDTVSGTFTFTSSLPIAVIALRGFTNRDGEFLMTTLPVAPLATPLTPFTTDTAYRGTVYFPHFADGSGWATQVILVNPTDDTIAGTVRFLGQGSDTAAAAPAVRTLEDGRTGSSFEYSIPPNGSYRIVTSNPSGGVSVGSVRAIPDNGHRAPSGLVVFSFASAGKTVLEAGVPALPAASAFRVYVESSGMPEQAGSIRSGLAITNAADTANTVTLEVTDLDGTLAAPPGHADASTVGAGVSFHRRILRLAAARILGSPPGHFDRRCCHRGTAIALQRPGRTQDDDHSAIDRNRRVDHGGPLLPAYRGFQGVVHPVHPVQRDRGPVLVWNVEFLRHVRATGRFRDGTRLRPGQSQHHAAGCQGNTRLACVRYRRRRVAFSRTG